MHAQVTVATGWGRQELCVIVWASHCAVWWRCVGGVLAVCV